ncbi:MAG: hypothetical protein WD071_05680 [Pseudohongiella sp.]|uniref:hypothetical protein n=1 Tax=Pseudohongiella sp. TaxID=1979412 RepID=UPI0034A093AE
MPASNPSPGEFVFRLWQDLADAEMLPPQWIEDAVRYFAPLAEEIGEQYAAQHGTLVVGINGAQGTGKSTLAKALALMLENRLNLTTTVLSLDDFYLSHAARQQLGQSVHPLLVTRGVPGTHDVNLAMETVHRLRSSTGDVALPGFDKSRDDCVARAHQQQARAPRNIIILEGWCLGVQAQTDAQLHDAINALELNEDTDGRWRHFVNQRLADDYQALFACIDYLVMLKAPSFDCVLEWRSLQEAKLAAGTHTGNKIMTPDAISRFIQHYERLTRHGMETLPALADRVLHLDADHRICCSSDRTPH